MYFISVNDEKRKLVVYLSIPQIENFYIKILDYFKVVKIVMSLKIMD